MKSYIFATTLLESAGIASAAEYPSMAMDTWCITYLSTYLAPISVAPIKRDVKKREAEGFVGADNPDVCTLALTFNLAEGQLFVGGLPTFYVGEDYKALSVQDEGSFIQGVITNTFGTSGRNLIFRNSGLPNGEAGFHQGSNGQVIRDFKLSVADLDAVTQCQNGRLVGFGTSTSALASSTEASTAESTSSGIFSGEESTTADTAVPAEFNSLTSDEPSSNIPETSGSEAPITA
ncbi:hypothetical protein F25303_13175 [Fusarium sp. NRRL 25303]|nr:hypothetical protein F25303_13175 [Fusarium sp. NRRL 25303]